MHQLIEQVISKYNMKEEQAVGMLQSLKEYVSVNFPSIGNTLDFIFDPSTKPATEQ